MTAAHDDARALFADLTGREPDGLWSAPGRVNLIGEHTDYNDGFVLPFAIPQRTVAAVGLRGDDRGRVMVGSTFAEDPVEVGLDELDGLFPTAPGTHPVVPEWAAYPLGVAWALRHETTEDGPFRGLDIAIASDVPVGAGLSSSAAIEGATASALNELWGTGLDATTLARVGRRAENEAVGAPTGIMDQMASMLGGGPDGLVLGAASDAGESRGVGACAPELVEGGCRRPPERG
uniref:galactokinase n=1 Tax=Microbacterium sp. TaxID=51671 RepID=UPI003A91DA38